MNAQNQTNLDIDNLLDGTLDDLADMPEFKPFPVGAHKVTIVSWTQKSFDDKKDASKKNVAMELKIKAIETVETANGSDEVCSPGQEENLSFFLVHHSSPQAMEMGQGQFKEVMKSLAAHFGAKSNRELIADSTGAEVLVTTSLRKDKSTPPKFYTKLDKLMVI